MSRRLLTVLLAALVTVAACGGESGGADTTSGAADPGDATTTTVATTVDSEDDDVTVGIDDIPQECIDAFVAYLQAIEPLIEEVDWANASMDDLEEMASALEPATADFEEATADSRCDDIEVDASDEESFEYLIGLAQEEAPGTVAYLEMIRDFAGDLGEATIDVSGDCETDIATLQGIIDEGGSMQEMTLADMTNVGSLVTSITANCSAERAAEFFSRDDVTDFMGG